MKFALPLLLVGLVLLALGAEGLYRAAASRVPRAVACEDVLPAAPPGAALRIAGCELDYLSASHRSSNGTITELLFPIKKPGQPAGTPATLVAVTRDPTVLAIAQETMGGGRQAAGDDFVVMMLRVVTALGAAREIQGVTRGSLLHRLADRGSLAAVRTPRAPGAMLLRMHAGPDWVTPGAAATLGLLAITAAAMLARRRPPLTASESGSAAAPEQEVESDAGAAVLPAEVALSAWPPPGAERGGVPPASRRAFRGLMLLNLPSDAGRDAIEHAPPLGTREEVVRQLATVLDGVRIDERGRGTVATPGLWLSCDIGTSPFVATAVVHAEGQQASVVLRRLAELTGWRLYVPREGSFLDAELRQHP